MGPVRSFTRGRERVTVATLAVLGVAGGALAGLASLSPGLGGGVCGHRHCGRPAYHRDIERHHRGHGGLVSGRRAGHRGACRDAARLPAYRHRPLPALGLTRHSYLLRAELAEQALAETRRAREAETEAAALAERPRIAREIHDALADSLAAVSVYLEAAEALLGMLPTGSPELGKAIECIGRASVFTKEGLADARRAILALRDDAAPLSDQLAELVKEYGTDGDVPVDLVITGAPRPVPAEASLAVYRTAQEALTNARKHAPGQPVRLTLDYAPAELTMQVVNPLPTLDTERPLAASGAGYGLTGLRERAALSGGTLTAGPADGEWRVSLRIPA